MNDKNVRFVLDSNKELTKKEEEFFLNVYHNLFIKIYGYDYYDAYLKVIDSKNYQIPPKDVSKNYNEIKEALKSLKEKNILLLKIYENELLIGMGRILVIRKKVMIKEIIFNSLDLDKEYFSKTVSYLIKYFQEKKYHNISIFIPRKDVSNILKLTNLGFQENYHELTNLGYIYSKDLEG